MFLLTELRKRKITERNNQEIERSWQASLHGGKYDPQLDIENDETRQAPKLSEETEQKLKEFQEARLKELRAAAEAKLKERANV